MNVKGVRHRHTRRRFAVQGGDILVELFWHSGYRTTGALVLHKPAGQYDVVFGRLGKKPKSPIFQKIRQLAIWLTYPEVRKVSKRLLGDKQFRNVEALMWAKEIDVTPPRDEISGLDHT